MKAILESLLSRRAENLADRIQPFLPVQGTILDIGSGTGHNARALRSRINAAIVETDVADMSVTGTHPVIFDGKHLPFPDNQFQCGLLLFVLQYVKDPLAFLTEANRVLSHKLIMIQSTYRGSIGKNVAESRDWAYGRFAFQVARRVGFIGKCKCPLYVNAFFERQQLEKIICEAGWKITCFEPQAWPLLNVSRDLYVLEKR